jgi:hypothetical protein
MFIGCTWRTLGTVDYNNKFALNIGLDLRHIASQNAPDVLSHMFAIVIATLLGKTEIALDLGHF